MKNKSTPESREFWAYVERIAKQVREKLADRRLFNTDQRAALDDKKERISNA